MNAYRFALTEHASTETRERIEQALEPPSTYRVGGAPTWYGNDDDAWDAWADAARR